MDSNSYGLIEMGLTFGLIIGFCVWQLVSLDRLKKRSKAKAEAARKAAEP